MSGHGHVTPNPDGSKARCGGPKICPECALEFARLSTPSPAPGAEPSEAAEAAADKAHVELQRDMAEAEIIALKRELEVSRQPSETQRAKDRVCDAAMAWWGCKRPLSFTVQQHIDSPLVNACESASTQALATECAALARIQEREGARHPAPGETEAK